MFLILIPSWAPLTYVTLWSSIIRTMMVVACIGTIVVPQTVMPPTEAFVNNKNYDTAATWLFTGLVGVHDDQGKGTYSAVVSNLGPNFVHQTGSVGWTGWSRYDVADLSCLNPNEAIVGIKSNIGLSGDRQWGLNCATIPGMEILDEGLSEDMLSMLNLDTKIPLPDADAADGWDVDFSDRCPLNHVITGFISVRSTSDKTDM